MQLQHDAVERARKVRLIILDVDGVLTDGQLHIGPDGECFKSFNCQDGLGISLAKKCGLKTAIITGRESAMVAVRAAELKIDALYQGQKNKTAAFQALCREYKLQAEEVAYIGDDLIDLPIMNRVGFAAAVDNAVAEVKASAHAVSGRTGGDGAVREFLEFIMKAQDSWDKIIQEYIELSAWENIEQ